MAKRAKKSGDPGEDTAMRRDTGESKGPSGMEADRHTRKAPVSCKSLLATGGGATVAVFVLYGVFAPESMIAYLAAAGIGALGGAASNLLS